MIQSEPATTGVTMRTPNVSANTSGCDVQEEDEVHLGNGEDGETSCNPGYPEK
jgi:hypothetical protein